MSYVEADTKSDSSVVAPDAGMTSTRSSSILCVSNPYSVRPVASGSADSRRPGFRFAPLWLGSVGRAPIAQFIQTPYPFDLVSTIVQLAIELDPTLELSEFILLRNRFRLICQDVTHFVDNRPVFWTRIVFTARAPLPFIHRCLSRSGSSNLVVSFRAHEPSDSPLYGHDWEVCSFIDYIEYAAASLADVLDRCTNLAVVADDFFCVSVVIDAIDLSEPKHLRSIDTTFSIQRYSEFCPDSLQHFAFSSNPPMGQTIWPPTALSWIGCSSAEPTVS
ncbi:hypothetical protein B0H16DRAFT_1725148 [Mycena metata]|uniref:Uncharacterized protein n=1 Tax=Mycena metata TaxID=1033252 RepID=A0AAD7IUQ5_9AGAR|nr:hypothetical protein B0H16DRAFT_1725148 [Mycena metata]